MRFVNLSAFTEVELTMQTAVHLLAGHDAVRALTAETPLLAGTLLSQWTLP
jgi:hypothetical protein